MKYLCLCYYEEKKFESWSPADLEAIGRECPPHDQALRASGRLNVVGSLALPKETRTIRPTDGGPVVTAGPFVPTREPLGAFFIVDAKDMAEAVSVASLHPGAKLGRYFGGGIEVQACEMIDQL
jgi:hypothetical protein